MAAEAVFGQADLSGVDTPPFVCNTPLHVIGVQAESPIAWSSDGKMLAYVSCNRSICIMESVSAEGTSDFAVSRILRGHGQPVKFLAFHPINTNMLISGGSEGTFVWDVAATTRSHVLPADGSGENHESDVECVCWMLDGSILATGSKDTNIKIWDVDAGFVCLETITGHKSSVMTIAYCKNVSLIASAGRDSTVKLWDASTLTGESREKRSGDKSIVCALVSNLSGHRGDVQCLAFSTNGRMLYSGARDNSMNAWDLTARTLLRELEDKSHKEGHHRGDVRSMTLVGAAGSHLLTCSMDSTLKLWELAPPPAIDAILNLDEAERHREETEAAILEQILGKGGAAAEVESKMESDKLLVTTEVYEDEGAFQMKLNPRVPLLAISSSSNAVKLFNVSNFAAPALVQEFRGHVGSVTEAELLDDIHLVTASDDFHIHQHNIGQVHRPQNFDFGSSVQCLAIRRASADKRGYILAGGADYSIRAYPLDAADYAGVFAADRLTRVQSHELVSVKFLGHAGRVTTLGIHPDGEIMASGAHDFNILLWKIKQSYPILTHSGTPREEYTIPMESPIARVDAHKGHVYGLRFAFESATPLLASCGNDHALKLWGVKRGVMGTSLSEKWSQTEAHDGVVSAVAWGKGVAKDTVFSAGWDRVIKVWATTNLRSKDPVAVLKGHGSRITDLDTSASGEYMVSVSTDLTAVVWSATAPFPSIARFTMSAHDGWLSSVTAGAEIFVTGSENGQVSVWPLNPKGPFANMFQAAAQTAAQAGQFNKILALGTGAGAGAGAGTDVAALDLGLTATHQQAKAAADEPATAAAAAATATATATAAPVAPVADPVARAAPVVPPGPAAPVAPLAVTQG